MEPTACVGHDRDGIVYKRTIFVSDDHGIVFKSAEFIFNLTLYHVVGVIDGFVGLIELLGLKEPRLGLISKNSIPLAKIIHGFTSAGTLGTAVFLIGKVAQGVFSGGK